MPRVAACPNIREAVIQTAGQLMQQLGYKKMTIDDISSELGIGKATLYGYFQNKQEVALAVIDGYHRHICESWNEIVASDLSSSEKLRQMIMSKVLFIFNLTSLHRQSLDDCLAQLRPLVMIKRDHYTGIEAEIIAGVLREGTQQGVMKCEELKETAKSIIACIAGLMPMNLSPRELASRDEVIEKTKRVTNLILRGIAADPSFTEIDLPQPSASVTVAE